MLEAQVAPVGDGVGGCVLVDGPARIGKTRLLDSLAELPALLGLG